MTGCGELQTRGVRPASPFQSANEPEQRGVQAAELRLAVGGRRSRPGATIAVE